MSEESTERQPVDELRIRIGMVVSSAFYRTLFRELSRRPGWVIEAVNPEDPDAIEAGGWDLVLLTAETIDHRLLEEVAHVSRSPRSRVMVLAEDVDPQHIADALNSGADDYLAVPFFIDECVARIHALVAQARGRGMRFNPQSSPASDDGSGPSTDDHSA